MDYLPIKSKKLTIADRNFNLYILPTEVEFNPPQLPHTFNDLNQVNKENNIYTSDKYIFIFMFST
jgi:hypothetical protein